MANIKSAKKRAGQNLIHRERNRYFKTTARTHIKKARAFIADGDIENAELAVKDASQALDKAAQKGIIHKNNAARRKSRLVLHLKQARAQQV